MNSRTLFQEAENRSKIDPKSGQGRGIAWPHIGVWEGLEEGSRMGGGGRARTNEGPRRRSGAVVGWVRLRPQGGR